MNMDVRLNQIARTAAAIIVSVALARFAHAAPNAPDGWITTKVKMSLLTTEGVSANDVDVDTIDGRVTLHGTVGTAGEKSMAEQVAKGVVGVREVRNILQVVAPRAQAQAETSDAQLKDRVSTALKGEPALANSSIAVQSVNAGVVLLAGKAASLSDSYRAVRVASSVGGVRRVASEIESPDEMADVEIWREGTYDAPSYGKSTASDMWITTASKMRLLSNSETPGFDINVDTENGVVTLFGVVDTADSKKHAEAEVRKVDGVKSVVNDLQVVAPSNDKAVAQSDAQILTAVEQRLEERPALADSDVGVEISNGVARLTGTVSSRSDHVTALTVTRSTNGVKRVIDDLRLEVPSASAR
jgi:hyperosmotically inducible protein